MRALIKWFVRTVVVAVVSALTVFFVGMRMKQPVVTNAVRRFNRDVGNPRQMKTAGTPGAYASIMRHVGRSSGKPYETPIVPVATDDGFVVLLPYGPNVDWLKNVQAAGTATLTHEGVTHTVSDPEIVSTASVAHQLPSNEVRMSKLFAVGECVVLRRVS
ncbi:MAG TPA: nitroreductase family deazaflavin-dependent oxidoreductase [Ilumatobacteraceae bacterium]|nr:nitroreductase family deazaflavin-dependent oxidoreductase [Ilumatobacteraceae bacterium]